MNRDTIVTRIHELMEWQMKARDLVNYNDFVKGYNTAVSFELEFLRKILSEFKA